MEEKRVGQEGRSEASTVAGGFETRAHGRGATYCYTTDRFKTISLHAVWVNPLTAAEASLGALVPAVLKRATQRWPSTTRLHQRLEELYGAHFRADVGKVADRQLISFHLELVDGRFLPGKPNTLAFGLDFLTEVLRRPLVTPAGHFDPTLVEQEKTLLLRRMEAVINDKGQYAALRLLESVAEGRPFGLRKWGQPEEVSAVAAEALYSYYLTLRASRPLLVLAVGAVDPDEVAAAARELISDPGEAPELQALRAYEPLHRGAEVVERQPVSQGKLQQAYATGMTAAHPDYPAMMMYAGVLGGFPHSKLFVNVREKASLAYYAYARLDGALGLMMVGAGIESAHYARARQIIEAQVRSMAEGQISEAELQFTREAYRNEIEAEQDSPDLIIGRKLETVLVGGGLSGVDLISALERVQRTDIERVAGQVLLDTTYFLTGEEKGEGQST
jgi:predicted Zn-dependent peptidase